MLLGSAVHQVIQKFQLEPPDIIEITDRGLRSIQPKNGPIASKAATTSSSAAAATDNDDAPPDYFSTLSVSAGAAPPPPQPPPPAPIITPIVIQLPNEFVQLDGLSAKQLDDLLEDELEFMSFCNKLPVTREIHLKSTDRLKENAKLANDNLKSEASLKYIREEVDALSHQLQTKIQEFDELEKRQNKICAPPDVGKVKRELAKFKRQAFDESERTAENWLDGDGDDAGVDQFLKKFVEERKLHHVRAAKLELLQVGGVVQNNTLPEF